MPLEPLIIPEVGAEPEACEVDVLHLELFLNVAIELNDVLNGAQDLEVLSASLP